jgi:hypothetical protein
MEENTKPKIMVTFQYNMFRDGRGGDIFGSVILDRPMPRMQAELEEIQEYIVEGLSCNILANGGNTRHMNIVARVVFIREV